jgi:hypothetical protein
MQIKPSTAAAPPVGITGVDRIENNVRARAKYLRFLIDRYYLNEPMTQVNAADARATSKQSGNSQPTLARPRFHLCASTAARVFRVIGLSWRFS